MPSVLFFKQIASYIFRVWKNDTAWNVTKYGVISGPYFLVFSPNTGKHGPEITRYLLTFHAVRLKGALYFHKRYYMYYKIMYCKIKWHEVF